MDLPLFNTVMNRFQVNQLLKENEDVAIGVAAGLAMYPVCRWITTFAEEGLKVSGRTFTYPADDIITLFKNFSSPQSYAFTSVLRIVGELAFTIFLDTIEPIAKEIMKETIFQGWVREKTKPLEDWIWGPGADSTAQKIVRIVISGLFFGFYHMSPFRGWVNIPIFVATGSAGIVLAALNEWRDDRTSSITAHFVHNAVAIAGLLV